MATIAPALSLALAHAPRIIWTGVSTADTMTTHALDAQHALAGSVAFTGTFGSSTVKLQASNDGTNYFDMKDVHGNAISATVAAYFEFSSTAAYIKPASSGGTADNVDVTIVLRG